MKIKSHDNTYLQLLRLILSEGVKKPAARENMPGSTSLFGAQVSYNLKDGFPLLTTKKMHFKGIVAELLWFLRGDTNIKYLVDRNVNIWNEDAYNYYEKIVNAKNSRGFGNIALLPFNEFISAVKEDLEPPPIMHGYRFGDCGHQYGKVWRAWDTIKPTPKSIAAPAGFMVEDQILNVLVSLYKTPESRRHIVTAIDPAHDRDLALYWCHAMFQFNTFVDKDGIRNLDVNLSQRSMDTFLGCAYNEASYSLLLHMFAEILGYKANRFVHSCGDAHIYDNHMDAVTEQLKREPYASPTLVFSIKAQEIFKQIANDLKSGDLDSIKLTSYFDALSVEDFSVAGYESHPAIKAELSTGMKKN